MTDGRTTALHSKDVDFKYYFSSCFLRDVCMQCIGRIGRVTELRDNAVIVKFTGIDQAWLINPAALSPAVHSLLYCVYISALFKAL